MSPSALTVTTTITAAGDVSDFDATTTTNMRAAIAQQLGVPVDSIVLTVAAASVRISFTVSTADSAQAAALQQTMQNTLATPESATNFFASAGANVTITSSPMITIAASQGALSLFPSMPSPRMPPPVVPPPPPIGGFGGGNPAPMQETATSAQTGSGSSSAISAELFLGVVASSAFVLLALMLVICVLVKRIKDAKAALKAANVDIYDVSTRIGTPQGATPSFQHQVGLTSSSPASQASFEGSPKMGRIAIKRTASLKKSPSGGFAADF